jgi:DNA-binding NarL/FixJ family response regulator
MISILLADDHAVVREGLKQILAEAFPEAAFQASSTIPNLRQNLREQRWDVLVLDLFMPGATGLSVLREIRQTHPQVPVLVLSSAPEEQLAVSVLRAGASGYLNKQAAPEHLVQAIRKLLVGGKYVSPTLAEQLIQEVERVDRPLHEKLSDREFQVLHLVVMGHSLKEIAVELSLSVKTIRTFRARLLEKLRLQSDVDLVHYAQRHQLVEPRNIVGPAPKSAL